jgi:hypothetical protein
LDECQEFFGPPRPDGEENSLAGNYSEKGEQTSSENPGDMAQKEPGGASEQGSIPHENNTRKKQHGKEIDRKGESPDESYQSEQFGDVYSPLSDWEHQ